MLYLVIAHDGRDPDAPTRRQEVRDQHLQGVRPLVDDGTVQLGGAYLDDQGRMAGSALLIEAEDEASVRALLDADVYTRHGVWERFEIYPFVRAV